MSVNDFKAFAIGKDANVLSQNEYEELEAVNEGFRSGIARSEQLNKVWRQASTIAAVLAQFMADKSGDNVADDGDLEKLRDTLTKALLNNATSQLDGRYLKSTSNLSDVANTATARGNLGLKGAAVQNVGTTSGTVAAGNDSRIVNAAQRGNNLSDLTDKAVSRNNLGLGNAATATVTTSSTDITSGRLLKVGDFGAGARGTHTCLTNILEAVKLGSGFYTMNGDGTSNPTIGAPVGSGNSIMGVLVIAVYTSSSWVYAWTNTRQWYALVNNTYTNASQVIWYSGYSSSYKPTASDVGALPLSGGTLSGALTVNADSEAIRLNLKTSGHASYIISRDVDGANTWYVGKGSRSNNDTVLNNYKGGNNRIELKESGQVNLVSANSFPIVASSDMRINGTVTPTNYSNFDTRYQAKNTIGKAVNGWFKDTSTGMIFMWGRATGGSDDRYYNVTLPIAFPSVFASLQVYPIYGSAITSSNVLSSAGEIKSNSQFGYGLSDSAGRPVTAKGVYWYAVGY